MMGNIFSAFNKLKIVCKYSREVLVMAYELSSDSHESDRSDDHNDIDPLIDFGLLMFKFLLVFPNSSRQLCVRQKSISFARRVMNIETRTNVPIIISTLLPQGPVQAYMTSRIIAIPRLNAKKRPLISSDNSAGDSVSPATSETAASVPRLSAAKKAAGRTRVKTLKYQIKILNAIQAFISSIGV